MAVKLTFQDGSEAICHYGVKGMKWHQTLKSAVDYANETSVNRDEFAGDDEGLKRAQARTDAFYGKRGKLAQVTEAQRRRRSSDNQERTFKAQGYSRGSDGVWRKKGRGKQLVQRVIRES